MPSSYEGNAHHLRTRLRCAESLVAKWLWRIARKARLAPCYRLLLVAATNGSGTLCWRSSMAVLAFTLLILAVLVAATWRCCGSRQHTADQHHSTLADIISSDKKHAEKGVATSPQMYRHMRAAMILRE